MHKWATPAVNLKEASFVAVMNENLRPNEWKESCTIRAFNDLGKAVRVTGMKSQSGRITRAITKLCVISFRNATIPPNVY